MYEKYPHVNIFDDIDGFFINAVRKKDLKDIILALDSGADIHCENDRALKISCTEGFLDIVKYLIEHGVDINSENGLICASYYGHFHIVKYLVEQGADVHLDDDNALWCSLRKW